MINWISALDEWLEKPEEFGHLLGFKKLTKIHGEWIRIFLKAYKQGGIETLQAHRGSFKTTCGIVALVLLFLCYPEIRILITRKKMDMAADVVKAIQNIFENNGAIRLFLKSRWGLDSAKTDVWSSEKTKFSFKKNITVNPSLTAAGVGGSITGSHFDYIWADDISTVIDRFSVAERRNTRVYWRELEKVVEPSGVRFLSGTPWHIDDVNAEVPEELFEGRRFPFGTVDLPAEDIAIIQKMKEKAYSGLSPLSEWCANYELRHVADKDTLGCFPTVETWGCEYCTAFLDSSFSDSADTDSTAVSVVGVRSDGTIVFTGAKYPKSIADYETRKSVILFLDRFNPVESLFESQLADASVFLIAPFQEMENELQVKIKNLWTVKRQHRNKHERIMATISAHRERIKMLTGTQQEFSIEVVRYSKHAEHDDAPDSLAGAIENLGTSPIIAEFAAAVGILREAGE
jgi:hypothetical protein